MAERKVEASSAVKAAEVDRLEARLRPAGLDAREIEQRVDQLQQPQRRCGAPTDDQLAVRRQQLAVGLGQHLLERAQHQGERRAELVADVGEEGGLGAVDLGQRLGAPALLFVGLGVGDRRGDLAGDEVEEARDSCRRTGGTG